ncbi:MAG: fucose isomerase [Clostridia bacterium]|nr:fucose isomerase [Clostridia bacterium]
MYKMPKIRIGLLPTKRHPRRLEGALPQKKRYFDIFSKIDADVVEYVDIDDVCPCGIIADPKNSPAVIDKFIRARVDAIFIEFLDFGNEESVSLVASALKVPTLVWGAQDPAPLADGTRTSGDIQCGIFAATKVLSSLDVKFSYIYNVDPETEAFQHGYDMFVRTVAVVKAVRGLRIAKFGSRPNSFLSVTADEADLSTKYGIVTVPCDPFLVSQTADEIIKENGEEFQAFKADMISRLDFGDMNPEIVARHAAMTLAFEKVMDDNGCHVGCVECWPTSRTLGLTGSGICMNLGELTDRGYPMTCETDVYGALTMEMLRAVKLDKESGFFADLTVRHPTNENAEMLWHCGPFPYSLKKEGCPGRVKRGRSQFELKDGAITVCRYGALNGKNYLFSGEGKAVDGPMTTGTYVYFEVSNWKRWEEKLMFGPYIHHVGGVYGNYKAALREAARYLGMEFDDPEVQGIYSL